MNDLGIITETSSIRSRGRERQPPRLAFFYDAPRFKTEERENGHVFDERAFNSGRHTLPS